MQLCTYGHETICFDPSKSEGICPCCSLRHEVTEADEETSKALAKVSQLEATIESLRNEIAAHALGGA